MSSLMQQARAKAERHEAEKKERVRKLAIDVAHDREVSPEQVIDDLEAARIDFDTFEKWVERERIAIKLGEVREQLDPAIAEQRAASASLEATKANHRQETEALNAALTKSVDAFESAAARVQRVRAAISDLESAQRAADHEIAAV